MGTSAREELEKKRESEEADLKVTNPTQEQEQNHARFGDAGTPLHLRVSAFSFAAAVGCLTKSS